MVLSSDMLTIIGLLTKLTEEKKIQWSPDRDLSRFLVRIDGVTFLLLRYVSGDWFHLSIRNECGALLAETTCLSPQMSPELAELGREVLDTIPKNDDELNKIIAELRKKLEVD